MVPARVLAVTGFQVEIDPARGGRWTSLVDPGGREWLWRRSDPARESVRPGDGFVDAGGVEECFPSITGFPDHGDVWSRPWALLPDGGMTVHTGDFSLTRWIRGGAQIVIDYRLDGPPGSPFVWAFHALLRPDVGTRIAVPATPCRVWSEQDEVSDSVWPTVRDEDDCDVLGPDDGTAVFCVLPDIEYLTVIPPTGRPGLLLQLSCSDAPVSFGLWRNLAGFPAGQPYRSFGVEPMLGRTPRVSEANPADAAVIPADGVLRWRLVISSA